MTTLTDSEWRKLAHDLSRRVGVAAPDWANTDARDPGVTMAELIAFLAESLLDRPDRSPRAQTRLTAIARDLADRVRDGSCGDLPPLTRNWYFYGKLMSEDDSRWNRSTSAASTGATTCCSMAWGSRGVSR